jgi:transcription termination/antitermination protein NusG
MNTDEIQEIVDGDGEDHHEKTLQEDAFARPAARGRQWYAIHTYSGYENAVVRNLKQRIDSLGMHDKIFDVVVPKQKTVKMKGTKRVEVEEQIYPGYVLVDMVYDPESWYVVRNTPRVTGFVGAGVIPVPLSEKEVTHFLGYVGKNGEARAVMDVERGEIVLVIDGPFKDMEGKISEIDREKARVKVMVSMFGRETPVELDFFQIKKM